MLAFEVRINARKVCTAGIDEPGLLSAFIAIRNSECEGRMIQGEAMTISVGALVVRTEEHIEWLDRQLSAGDEISLRIVEADDVDPRRQLSAPLTPAEKRRNEKIYVRRKAKEFGWKIQAVKKPRTKS